MKTIPVYVERLCNGKPEWLRVDDWYYQAWNGCFCLIEDRP